MCDFIQDHMNEFQRRKNDGPGYKCLTMGPLCLGYFHLGIAMHPVMDSTSPCHRYWQHWPDNLLCHALGFENKYVAPGHLEETVGAMNSVYNANGCSASWNGQPAPAPDPLRDIPIAL